MFKACYNCRECENGYLLLSTSEFSQQSLTNTLLDGGKEMRAKRCGNSYTGDPDNDPTGACDIGNNQLLGTGFEYFHYSCYLHFEMNMEISTFDLPPSPPIELLVKHYIKLSGAYNNGDVASNCSGPIERSGASASDCPTACDNLKEHTQTIIIYESDSDLCKCYDTCTQFIIQSGSSPSTNIYVSKNLYHGRLNDFPEALWLNIAPQELIWYNKDVISNGTSINNKTIVKNIGDIINFVLNTTGTETIHLLDSACPRNIHTTHKNKSLLYPISTKTAEYSFMILGKYGNIYISEHNSYCIYNLNDYFNMHFTIRF